jgi:hypothetical protein
MKRSTRVSIAVTAAAVIALIAAVPQFAGDKPAAAPSPAPPAPAGNPACGGAAAEPVSTAAAPAAAAKGAAQPAAAAYDRMKALVGDWIDVDGMYGMKDQVAVTYRLTGNGTTVVETSFIGTPHEMITMYSRDGDDLVLTHYCAAGNQPRMRARTFDGATIEFAYDGGTNLDPAKDMHMHSARLEFVSADEIRGAWTGWEGGKQAGDHQVMFHLKRKTA